MLLVASPALGVEPPGQPESGPGGSDYEHGFARISFILDGFSAYYLYEPMWPTPDSAPVLLYLGGLAGPGPYWGLIEFSVFAEAYKPMFTHLARKGFIVIFPAYGPFGATPAQYEGHAVQAAKKALARLEDGTHVAPELDEFAIAGHSFGGLILLSVANRYEELELPRPRALIAQEPTPIVQIVEACQENPQGPFCDVELPGELDGIPADTINVTVVGGRNRMSLIKSTIRQWELPQVPDDLENLLFIHDDENDGETLIATHMSPGAYPLLPIPGFELNAIDWYGYWKPTEAALDFAFYGENGGYVLGDGDDVRFMGLWSDGVPVRAMSTVRDFLNP